MQAAANYDSGLDAQAALEQCKTLASFDEK
jgi:hypothetical protein